MQFWPMKISELATVMFLSQIEKNSIDFKF